MIHLTRFDPFNELVEDLFKGNPARSFTLPQELDEGKSEARFRDGVLELTLPKKQAAATKQISIQ